MIAWFVKNTVAANILMITIVLAGLYSLSTQIPLEVFPSFASDRITVTVVLRGSTPEDVEKGVSIRIEEAVQDLEGVQKITSRSTEGSGKVVIEVANGYNARDMLADVKSRIDAINTFPVNAEKPIIALAQRKRNVISVSVSSDYGEKELREFAQRINDELLTIPGVTQLSLSGIRNYEIDISVSQDKLQQYHLSLQQISNAISQSSADISAGNIKTRGGDVLIRSKGQAYRKNEFENIVVKQNSDGSILRLKDIATINDGFEETPVRTRFNGKQAAFIDVFRIGSQSAIDVADKVKSYIKKKQAELPKGYKLNYWNDRSRIVKNRISTLTTNALQGGILVLALLTLFLRPYIAFWVFMGIPVAFMGAFIVMPYFGITLNVLSLFGFILVLGIVVDDAIVTGENVYTHLQHAESGEQAAINGTMEVATPVTFGALTTVAAFLPLAFIEGARGALFAQIPAVVIPVLIFSLIESKLVLPAHLKHIKLRHQNNEPPSKFERFQQRFADGFENTILKYYQPLLAKVLRNKLTTLSFFTAIFVLIIVLVVSGWSRFVFFPRVPSVTVRANLTLPVGTPFEVTNKYVISMSDKAEKLQQKYTDKISHKSVILNILATTGGRGGQANIGQVRVELVPPEQRHIDVTSQQIVREWRKMIGVIPGAKNLSFRAEIGRSSDPIDIQLTSTSLKILKKVADKVKQHLATYPALFDIADSLSDGKQELRIKLTKQGLALGLTRVGVTKQVRRAYFGAQAQRIQRGRDDVRVMVLLPLNERNSIAQLKKMLIRTPSGGEVPLDHIATLKAGQSPAAINRIDRFRTVSVTADLDKNSTNMTILQRELKVYLETLTRQYPNVGHSLEGEAKEQRQSFSSLKWGLVIVLFVIYALLAIPFKSFIQPLIVMSIIPFGFIGAMLGHWIMGMNLTIMSLLGMLALVGVVVNDSLVLVDFINKKRQQGTELMNAVTTAAAARFRPVMLTSLTTFLGLLPLLFAKSTQAQFLIPMAVSLGFGILFSTFITLLLVPVNYVIMDKIVKTFSGKKQH